LASIAQVFAEQFDSAWSNASRLLFFACRNLTHGWRLRDYIALKQPVLETCSGIRRTRFAVHPNRPLSAIRQQVDHVALLYGLIILSPQIATNVPVQTSRLTGLRLISGGTGCASAEFCPQRL